MDLQLQYVEERIQTDLLNHSLQGVFHELHQLRAQDPRGFDRELMQINADLHGRGMLPVDNIVREGSSFALRSVNEGYSTSSSYAANHYYQPAEVNRERYAGYPQSQRYAHNSSYPSRYRYEETAYAGRSEQYSYTSPLAERVAYAASHANGQQLWTRFASLTRYGREGCVASDESILQRAGYADMSHLDVRSFASALRSRGWQPDSFADRRPGDIVIASGDGQHTGIVGDNGSIYANDSYTTTWHAIDASYWTSHWPDVYVLHPPGSSSVPHLEYASYQPYRAHNDQYSAASNEYAESRYRERTHYGRMYHSSERREIYASYSYNQGTMAAAYGYDDNWRNQYYRPYPGNTYGWNNAS